VEGLIVERRLKQLEVLWQTDSQAVREASYSIECALKWPRMGLRESDPAPDPGECAARIAGTHDLDAAGIERAITLLYRRWGLPAAEAHMVAALGLMRLLEIAMTLEAA
jgi:hypothetical protein